MSNVAILWDIENVTPSTDSLFMDGLWEYAEQLGRVVSARAYCDWSKPAFKKLGPQLGRFHFYLVHVPRPKGQKNSADMSLVTDTLELLNYYDHVATFVLITGDSDFRPLVLALRRAGKNIHIVCDMKKASDELLALADSFQDFRELVPAGDDEGPGERSATEAEAEDVRAVPREYWYELLAETASIMLRENKVTNIGAVKIRLRMLNPNFDEKALKFRRWSDFVAKAANAGYITVEEKDTQPIIYPRDRGATSTSTQQRSFDQLVEILTVLDDHAAPEYHEFAAVNSRLKDRRLDFKGLGYRKFKDFVQAAEARGLVESKSEGLRRLVRRTPQKAPTPSRGPRRRRKPTSTPAAEGRAQA